MARGEAVAICDGRRSLAVDTLAAQNALTDQWLAQTAPRRWWKFW
jgi:hypothetical protein